MRTGHSTESPCYMYMYVLWGINMITTPVTYTCTSMTQACTTLGARLYETKRSHNPTICTVFRHSFIKLTVAIDNCFQNILGGPPKVKEFQSLWGAAFQLTAYTGT